MHSRRHPDVPPQANWHTLSEFTVRATPGSERRAADRVAARIRQLGIPPEFVEQIRTAIAQATRNAIERNASQPPATLVGIHILLSAEPPPERSEPRQKVQGWGFFLISRMSESAHAEPGSVGPIIELILYPEGNAQPQRLKGR